MAILDTDTGPNFIREERILNARAPLMYTMKASHLRIASNKPMEVRRIINLHLQIGKLHRKVEFPVVSALATNTFLSTAFISRYIKKNSPKAKPISAMNSSPSANKGANEKFRLWLLVIMNIKS